MKFTVFCNRSLLREAITIRDPSTAKVAVTTLPVPLARTGDQSPLLVKTVVQNRLLCDVRHCDALLGQVFRQRKLSWGVKPGETINFRSINAYPAAARRSLCYPLINKYKLYAILQV